MGDDSAFLFFNHHLWNTFSVKMRAFGVAIFIPGGEQALLMELFRENNGFMNGYFHAWVGSKIYLWMFFV
ncbi:hypothetical protein B4119_1424 [Parageobacillus caldoxylosilyticus]|uniref:Uncharacterized protein n=1 Tax=Saccharococcus caldoxylosilyticus TaxID=81408 RepID=A0A150LQD6_9BACL|nr:hypothetical protein B4119_1424 [Parageobacillus caldoxylosilyticus]